MVHVVLCETCFKNAQSNPRGRSDICRHCLCNKMTYWVVPSDYSRVLKKVLYDGCDRHKNPASGNSTCDKEPRYPGRSTCRGCTFHAKNRYKGYEKHNTLGKCTKCWPSNPLIIVHDSNGGCSESRKLPTKSVKKKTIKTKTSGSSCCSRSSRRKKKILGDKSTSSPSYRVPGAYSQLLGRTRAKRSISDYDVRKMCGTQTHFEEILTSGEKIACIDVEDNVALGWLAVADGLCDPGCSMRDDIAQTTGLVGSSSIMTPHTTKCDCGPTCKCKLCDEHNPESASRIRQAVRTKIEHAKMRQFSASVATKTKISTAKKSDSRKRSATKNVETKTKGSSSRSCCSSSSNKNSRVGTSKKRRKDECDPIVDNDIRTYYETLLLSTEKIASIDTEDNIALGWLAVAEGLCEPGCAMQGDMARTIDSGGVRGLLSTPTAKCDCGPTCACKLCDMHNPESASRIRQAVRKQIDHARTRCAERPRSAF